LEKISLYTRF
jgi:hypothetical protein